MRQQASDKNNANTRNSDPCQTQGFHLALKGENKQQSSHRANRSTEFAMPCHNINFALDNHDVLLDSSS